MDVMQNDAYKWAKQQNYTSVAAQYAKKLAETIDKLIADQSEADSSQHKKIVTLSIENTQLRSVVQQFDPDFFFRKCRACGCDWNHPCNDHDFWVEDDLCSVCAEQGLGDGHE
jgi:hypothetical protein